MSNNSPPIIADKLAVLRSEFQRRLPDRIAEIEHAWQLICADIPSADNAWDDLQRLLHNLAGSGGVFGAPAISKLAYGLSESLRPHLGNSVRHRRSEELKNQISRGIVQLKEMARLPVPEKIAHVQPQRIPRAQAGGFDVGIFQQAIP